MSIFVPEFIYYDIYFNIIKYQCAKNAQRSARNAQEFVDKISICH